MLRVRAYLDDSAADSGIVCFMHSGCDGLAESIQAVTLSRSEGEGVLLRDRYAPPCSLSPTSFILGLLGLCPRHLVMANSKYGTRSAHKLRGPVPILSRRMPKLQALELFMVGSLLD